MIELGNRARNTVASLGPFAHRTFRKLFFISKIFQRRATLFSVQSKRSILILSLLLPGCDSPTRFESIEYSSVSDPAQLAILVEQDTVLTIAALKWKGGARASVSITYDDPDQRLATDAVIERGMRLDLELVSSMYAKTEFHHWIDTYKRDLVPHGIRFFGHGHTHAFHDTMTFDEAYESFKTNFDFMKEWGLNPKAYAYPGSSGKRRSTQLANRLAGFICARGSTIEWNEYFIAPHAETEPQSWYFLPSVVMGNASNWYIDVHEKLVPILDEAVAQGAWVILTYHSIGIPQGWSYYPIDDFRQDLEAIQTRNIWNANMDAAAAYLAERNSPLGSAHRSCVALAI